MRALRSLLAPTIVGREGVLRAIDTLVGPDDAPPRVLLLGGDAGVGKTRLASAAVAAAREAGRVVIEGRANPIDRQLPLGVYRNALRASLRRGDLPPIDDELAAMFPRWLLPELGDPTPGELDVVFEAATRFMRAIAIGGGALLVLEDLHMAVHSTCALTTHLAVTLRDAPVAIMLTYRDAEASVALDETRTEIIRQRLGTEVHLAPLGKRDVAEMLESILGAPPSGDAVASIAEASAGNPFAIEEILRECVEAGWLDPERGTWIAPSRLPVPRAVHDLLTARVRELSRVDQDILQWIAVLGERIDLTLLRLASECDDAVLRDAIDRLCSVGLLADAGPGTPGVRFRHALGREAVLAGVSGVTRVLRHERVLAMLEARPARVQGEQLEQLLTHALAAGDDVRAFGYSLRAAQRARGLGARRETADHVAQALRLWTPAAGEEARVEALLEHGRVLSAIGDNTAAIDVLDDARDAAIEVGRRDVAALALALCADARWDVNRRRDVLADLLQSRLEAANADATTAMRGEITALLARAYLLSGEPVRAAGVAREGLILVTRRMDSVRLGLRITLGAALIGAGEDGDGRDELLAVIRETAQLGDPLPRLRALLKLAAAPLEEPAERVRHALAAVELARAKGLDNYEGRALWILSAGHLAAGDWDEVDAAADAAEDCLSRADADPVAVMGIRVIRAARERRSGRVPEAIRLFAAVIDEAQARGIWEHELEARVGLARCQMAVGDAETATVTLAPALRQWGGLPGGAASPIARLLLTGVEVAAGLGDAARATEMAGQVAERMSGPRVTYALALAEAANGRCPPTGQLIQAVDHVAALGRRPEAARMALTGANALLSVVDTGDEAAALVERALALYEQMGSQAFGERAEGILRGLGRRAATSGPTLTAREREVLGLIVEGLTNRAIAERLVIGESTVARHVFNLFNKLGVHTRAQAAVFAIEHRLLK